MGPMNRTLQTLVILALVLLAMGQIAQAQGPSDHAGPPDHASNEEPKHDKAPDHVDGEEAKSDKAPSHTKRDTPNEPTHEDGPPEDEPSTREEDGAEATSSPDPTTSPDVDDEPIETTSTPSNQETDTTLPPTDEDQEGQDQDDDVETVTSQPAAEALPEGPTPLQGTFHQRTDTTTLPKSTLTQAFAPTKEGASRTQGASTTFAPNADAGWILPSLFMLGLGALAAVTLRTPQPPEPATASEEETEDEEAPMFQPQPGLEGVLMLGKSALDHGDNDAAIGWFETAIALKPNLQAAHFCLGLCLDDAGHLDQAQDALDNAHELEPNDPLARYALASIHARQGATRQALHHVHHVAQALPALAATMLEDGEFTTLHDHPRFLALLGEL